MTTVDAKYHYLIAPDMPKMVRELLKLHGTAEVVGPKNNPTIIQWARELGLTTVYRNDEIAWCGLAVAIAAKRAGKDVVHNPLWARNWAKFGTGVKEAMIGDVLVFSRGAGGHVGLYVGEDKRHYYVLGGNQGNRVSIVAIPKWRLLAARRPEYKSGQPASVRKMVLAEGSAAVSKDEA